MNMFSTLFIDIMEIVYTLMLAIDSILYGLFGWLYSIYVELANARIFSDEIVQDFTNRIYIIIGVVALFAVAYSLLHSIINPDDAKKSAGFEIFKRLLIAIILVPLIPVLFNFLYGFQYAILNRNVITDLFLGTAVNTSQEATQTVYTREDNCSEGGTTGCITYTCGDGSTVSVDKNAENWLDVEVPAATAACGGSLKVEEIIYDPNTTRQKQIGYSMALSVFNGFVQPAAHVNPNDVMVEVQTEAECLSTGDAMTSMGPNSYTNYVLSECYENKDYSYPEFLTLIETTGNFGLITSLAEPINEDSVEYQFLISTLAAGFLLYILFSFTIDLGIRAAKLAFYQLIAPVPLFLSILPANKDLVKNWFKNVLTTYVEVFVRIICMSAVAFLATNISSTIVLEFGFMANAFIIMGLVAFAKQLPKIFSDITGIKSEGMGIGLKALQEKLGAGGALAAGAAIGGGATALTRNAVNAYKNKSGVVKGAGSAFAGGLSGTARGLKSGWGAKTISEMKSAAGESASGAVKARKNRAADIKRYTAKGENFLGGRINDLFDDVKEWSGYAASLEELDSKIQINENITKEFDNIKGVTKNIVGSQAVNTDKTFASKALASLMARNSVTTADLQLAETFMNASFAGTTNVTKGNETKSFRVGQSINNEAEFKKYQQELLAQRQIEAITELKKAEDYFSNITFQSGSNYPVSFGTSSFQSGAIISTEEDFKKYKKELEKAKGKVSGMFVGGSMAEANDLITKLAKDGYQTDFDVSIQVEGFDSTRVDQNNFDEYLSKLRLAQEKTNKLFEKEIGIGLMAGGVDGVKSVVGDDVFSNFGGGLIASFASAVASGKTMEETYIREMAHSQSILEEGAPPISAKDYEALDDFSNKANDSTVELDEIRKVYKMAADERKKKE